MDDIIQQFEKYFKAWLENKYILSGEPDQVKKLNDIEKASDEYVDRYLLETNLIARDLAFSIQHILDDFIRTNMK